MVTVTFAIKPYLARYMYVRYGQSLELLSHNNPPSRLPIPIHLSHLTPIYHFLHQLSVPHPQGVSWKETGNITFVLPSPRQGKNPEVYNYFGQDSIFIIEKEIEVEMKAELYSFLLENKFKNGVMYIKSMHEFVVRYDMAESVEEENEEMTLRKNHTLFNSDHLITTGYTTLKKKYQKQPTLII